jgi:flagellar basal body rod protein FlgG
MNYGLYLSASGLMSNLYRQDVFANNLSNVETAGFKEHVPAVKHRAPESIEDNLGMNVSKQMLDKLGGGVLAGPQRISFGAAKLTKTGNPLDAALTSDNTFFAVETMTANGNQTEVALTRDGNFSRNSEGELVTQSGHRVLNDQDQPIAVPEGANVRIDSEGRVLQNGQPLDRVQVTRIDNTEALSKQGANLFAMDEPNMRQMVDNPAIKSGFVEASAVDPISTLSQLISATKSATGNATMIKYHNRVMGQAITELGRIQ